MNRRGLLKSLLGACAALIGGRAVAETDFDPDGLYSGFGTYTGHNYEFRKFKGGIQLAPTKAEGEVCVYDCTPEGRAEYYEDKYWEAQRHIDELYG